MLRSLELENFKAFGERARIPFAPITLIFGENSAGKSSILHALNLLKQTWESRDTGFPLLPRSEGGIVDLGSFQEMLFDHDLKRTLSIRVGTEIDDVFEIRENKISVELSFKRPSLEDEVLLDEIKIYSGESSECVAEFKLSESSAEPKRFSITRGFFLHPFYRDLQSAPASKLVEAECTWVTKSAEYWEPEFKWCKENLEEIQTRLKDRKAYLEELLDNVRNSDERKNSNEEDQEIGESLQRDIDSLNRDIVFFSSNFDLPAYISKRRNDEMHTVLGLQGFLPTAIMPGERNSWITGPRSLLSLLSDAKRVDVAELAMSARHALEQTLEVLFPMGPFRRPPERWYISPGITPPHVGYRGDWLPDLLLRSPELIEETNEWLQRLGIGYKLEVKSVSPTSGDLFEVRLIDTHREEQVKVALPDVGYGISQLLPFVVQSLVSENRIISIEQPEVHVHPKLQADIGDLLAEAIREPRSNQFIIETHSEHLILRLQRLIREEKIEPTDVAVIYVSRGADGAEVKSLGLDEDGDFIDEWPNGFFPERLRELR